MIMKTIILLLLKLYFPFLHLSQLYLFELKKLLTRFFYIYPSENYDFFSLATNAKISIFSRKNWGLIGVVTKLFRLWYHETHPVDMQALMRPHKEKIDAALAFYSILGKLFR